MINHQIALHKEVDGASLVETKPGSRGHVIWGPYEQLPPGEYKVIFKIMPIDTYDCVKDNVVAKLDVATDFGRSTLATKEVTVQELGSGTVFFEVLFSIGQTSVAEYRVEVFGNARLEIDAYRPRGNTTESTDYLTFPPRHTVAPEFFDNNRSRIRQFYELGFRVNIDNDRLVFEKDGIQFFVDSGDDLNMIEEIFIEQVYRFSRTRPTIVIDIGMNVALVAMQFAKNPAVKAIYSFEPFKETYDRALANLEINPDLAHKIFPSQTGISDVEGSLTFNVYDTETSGSRSTRDTDTDRGILTNLKMQTAARVVREVRQRHPDCDIAMKIDCEGGEFKIFDNLVSSELLNEISVFMVEWHALFPGKSQQDLISPLVASGFTVIDRSPLTGNGFFYAVK